MLRKSLYIVGGLFVTAVSAAAVMLGMWAYNLNNQLSQSKADYQALQSDYATLQSEYSRAQEEYKAQASQADSDLSVSKAQVTELENKVKKLESENDRLRTQMAEIQDHVAMLSDFWFTSDSAFERKVNTSDDEQLKELYANLQKSQAMEDYIDLMSYMIQNIDNVSEVSWLPLQTVNALKVTGDVR